MSEWLGVAATTITDYIRGDVDNTIRNRKWLAMLNGRGLMTFNHEGINVQWNPRYLQNALIGFDDGDTLSFPRVNRHKNAVIDWRGYAMPEQIGIKEKEMNKGQAAIVKVFSNKAKWMAEDIKAQLSTELYVDGNATNNGKRWHGIESFMSVSGTVSGSKAGNPNDTYAGLSTALGTYGGTWNGNWPEGTGPTQYDFWSPLVVDYTNALWPQTTKTWAYTAIDAIAYGLMAGRRNDGADKQVDIVLLDRNLYYQFTQLLRAEERLNITPNVGSSGLWKLGFTDITNFDGCDITWEYGVPANVGYGIPMNEIELMSLMPDLSTIKGPFFSEEAMSYRWAYVNFSNLRFESIRNFIKWQAIS